MALQRYKPLRRNVKPLLKMQGRCCNKKRFATEKAAQAALFRIARTTPAAEYPQRAYECPYGWWHLTKQAKRTGPPPTAEELVYERDQYRCAQCGVNIFKVPDRSVHHRRNRASGGSSKPEINSPANLLLVCGTGTTLCHGWIGDHPAMARDKGFAVSTNGRKNPREIPVEHAIYGRVYLTDDGGWRPA